MSDLRIPSCHLHKASGLPVVELSGEMIYLGKYGSPESKAEYEKEFAEWQMKLPLISVTLLSLLDDEIFRPIGMREARPGIR